MRISRRVRGGGFQWAILPRHSLNHQFDAPGAAQVMRDFIVHICWDNSTDMQRTSCVAITPQANTTTKFQPKQLDCHGGNTGALAANDNARLHGA